MQAWRFCLPDDSCPLSPVPPPAVRYASLGAHEERDQSRKDDLESLLYVFLDLYIGKLPWAEHVSPRVVNRNVMSCIVVEAERGEGGGVVAEVSLDCDGTRLKFVTP